MIPRAISGFGGMKCTQIIVKTSTSFVFEAWRRYCLRPLGAFEGCGGGDGSLMLLVGISIMLQRDRGGIPGGRWG